MGLLGWDKKVTDVGPVFKALGGPILSAGKALMGSKREMS